MMLHTKSKATTPQSSTNNVIMCIEEFSALFSIPGEGFVAEILDRRQKRLRLIQVLVKGQPETNVLMEESSSTWMPVRGSLHFLTDEDKAPTGFVWRSCAEDLPRVVTYDWSGNQKAVLTDEDTHVDRIVGFSQKSGLVFFGKRRLIMRWMLGYACFY